MNFTHYTAKYVHHTKKTDIVATEYFKPNNSIDNEAATPTKCFGEFLAMFRDICRRL